MVNVLRPAKDCAKVETKPCRIYDTDKIHLLKENTYLAGSDNPVYDVHCYLTSDRLYFSATSPGGDPNSYEVMYIKEPSEIDGSTQPVLDDMTHDSFIYYAFAQMLRKDQQFEQAEIQYAKFLDHLQRLP